MKAKIIKFTDTNKKPFATKYIYIYTALLHLQASRERNRRKVHLRAEIEVCEASPPTDQP